MLGGTRTRQPLNPLLGRLRFLYQIEVYTHLHWSKRHQHSKAAEVGTITHGVCEVGGLLVATVGGPGATLAPVSTSICRRGLFNVLSKRNGPVQFIGFHHFIGQFPPFITNSNRATSVSQRVAFRKIARQAALPVSV